MDSYSSSYSSSKSSYISHNTKKPNGSLKNEYPLQSHYSWLHSVRKSPSKKMKKAPVAPMPPTPIKVYKVEPINFKEIVQQLTCAPEFMPPQSHDHNLLQSIIDCTPATVASPPRKKLSSRVDTVEVSPISTTNNWYQYFETELLGKSSENEVMTPGLMEMNLFTPNAFSNWCFVPLMSPTV